MTDTPQELAIVDASDVSKAALRSLFRDRVALRMANAAEVNALDATHDGGQQQLLSVDGVTYRYDSADVATADDGVFTLVTADGRRFKNDRMVAIRSTSLTINVAVGGNIQAALDLLCRFHFVGSATGTVLLASGTHTITTALLNRHHQPGKITLAGTAATPPAVGSFTGTYATDLATMQAAYPTRIETSGGGVSLTAGQTLTINDVLFVRTGSQAGNGILASGAQVTMTRVGMINFNVGAYATFNAFFSVTSCTYAHNVYGWYGLIAAGSNQTTCVFYGGTYGVYCSEFAMARVSSSDMKACTYGVYVFQSAYLYVNTVSFDGHGVSAVLLDNSRAYIYLATISNCTSYAIANNNGSSITVNAVTVSGTATGKTIRASAQSVTVETGTHTGAPTFSPAVGAEGNQGSWTI